ncbi:hypothetical protein FOZ61_004110, partial [Perkinsus olseni]
YIPENRPLAGLRRGRATVRNPGVLGRYNSAVSLPQNGEAPDEEVSSDGGSTNTSAGSVLSGSDLSSNDEYDTAVESSDVSEGDGLSDEEQLSDDEASSSRDEYHPLLPAVALHAENSSIADMIED